MGVGGMGGPTGLRTGTEKDPATEDGWPRPVSPTLPRNFIPGLLGDVTSYNFWPDVLGPAQGGGGAGGR